MRRRSARHYLRSGRGQMTPDSLVQLSIAEAALGQNEEALRHARHATEMLPPSVDAVGGAHVRDPISRSAGYDGRS